MPPEPPPPPPPEPAVVRGPAKVLQVAGDPERHRRLVTVDARTPRTPIGHFLGGTRLRISVLETRWTNDPAGPFVDASGRSDQRCGSPGHACVGRDDDPMMGLVLVSVPTAASTIAPEAACAPRHRLFIPHGVEFAVPEDTELALAPNGWADALSDNTGALRIDVEIASGAGARASSRRRVEVDAKHASTSLGRFHAGEYVRISIVSGRWSQGPGAALVDASGAARVKCASSAGHTCLGGDATAPLMGLMLVVGPCSASPAQPAIGRRFIPHGIEMTVIRESDLFLGPNAWEDGCANNAGAAVVEVETDRP
ncbi:Hypothetical protein A7982_05635 [Minicystis rosea]|nr:Hypothetical protein A7982_05635 [Minicystis rosea]